MALFFQLFSVFFGFAHRMFSKSHLSTIRFRLFFSILQSIFSHIHLLRREMEKEMIIAEMKNKKHRMMRRMILLLTIVIAGVSQTVHGQEAAVKTNLLSDVFFNPNLGLEIGLAPKWTLDITGQFNAWTLSHDRRWKHWVVQPRGVTGSATAFPVISSVYTFTEANTTSGASTVKSIFWVPTLASSKTPAIKAGSSVPVWHTAMHGFSVTIGTLKRKSVSATPIPDTTGSAAPVAARKSRRTNHTTTWVPPKRRSI